MKLLLIRHGKTYFNELDLTQGWCDSPLSEIGMSQAKALAQKIKDIAIDEAYSSTSERAYDTLEIALNNPFMTIKRDRRLKELNFGYFEGQPNSLLMLLNVTLISCKKLCPMKIERLQLVGMDSHLRL